jgi:hypothetical protein
VALPKLESPSLAAEIHTPATSAPLYLTVPVIEPPRAKATSDVVVAPAVTAIDDTVWTAYEDDVAPKHVASITTEYVPTASPGIVYVPPGPVVALP